ncbi:helix-turn-helix domain-containing protein [Hyalangium versicolor]|uniref:helix-turn-helix domain-containing protein n=1 Tax=Hyalangium versicolor TaxID=2861190 RepID=UPI001CCAB3BF|nr:helix-turn-helix transcriptional regulator [Hyalangium versicolor]
MPELFAAAFGKAVRAARQRAQLTPEQVARAIELPPVAYGRLERGLLLPSVQTLVHLSQLLRTPTDVLMGHVLPEPSQPASTP